MRHFRGVVALYFVVLCVALARLALASGLSSGNGVGSLPTYTGPASTTISVSGGTSSPISLTGGPGSGAGGNGANLTLNSGSNGVGGGALLAGGNSAAGSNAGDVTVRGGYSSSVGSAGNVIVQVTPIGGTPYVDVARFQTAGSLSVLGGLKVGTAGTASPAAAGQILIADGMGGVVNLQGSTDQSLRISTANNMTLTAGGVVQVSSSILYPASNGGTSFGQAGVGYAKLYVDYTNTATVGNVTINKAAGRVNMGAAATSFSVTNSLVTAASHVFLQPQGTPAAGISYWTVTAAGSFTINTNVVPGSNQAIDFFVVNAD